MWLASVLVSTSNIAFGTVLQLWFPSTTDGTCLVHKLMSSNTVTSKYNCVKHKVIKIFWKRQPVVLSVQFKKIQTQQCLYKTVPFYIVSLHVPIMMTVMRPSVYITV